MDKDIHNNVVPGTKNNIFLTLKDFGCIERDIDQFARGIKGNFMHYSLGWEGSTKDGKYVSFKHNLTTKDRFLDIYNFDFFDKLLFYSSKTSLLSDKTFSGRNEKQYWHDSFASFVLGDKRSIDLDFISIELLEKISIDKGWVRSIFSNPGFIFRDNFYKEFFRYVEVTDSNEIVPLCLDYFKVSQSGFNNIQLINNMPFYDQAIQLGMDHLPIVTDLTLLSFN